VSQSVQITPAALEWAIEEDGMPVPELADRLGVPEAVLEAWTVGEELPTKGQFSRLAEVLRRPRALFFLPSAPSSSGVPADLRGAPGLLGRALTPEERRLIRLTMRLQSEASRLFQQQGERAVMMPSAGLEDSQEAAGGRLRAWLQVPVSIQTGWSTSYAALRAWRQAVEDARVIVLQLQLGARGIRGFSLMDDFAPLIAVNTGYNAAARVFSIFHELAHLIARSEAACAGFYAPSGGGTSLALERWCERVASAALLPGTAFESAVGDRDGRVSSFDDARRLADRFNVSIRAIAIRAIRMGLADPDFYAVVEENAVTVDRATRAGGGGGRVTAQKRFDEYGRRLPGAVLRAAANREIPLRDAVDLMGITTSQVADLERLVTSGDAL